MNEQTLTILINGIISLFGALPGIIDSINNMGLSDSTKEELLARIKKAQESLPVWE